MPWEWARAEPTRLFVGIDADASGLRQISGRAFRAGLPNLVYVRAAVEALPFELAGIADRVTVVLPWGSLLAAVLRPSVEVLRGVRGLCRSGARLTTVVAAHPLRDAQEAARLGIPTFEPGALPGSLAPVYAEAGFDLTRVRVLQAVDAARWRSTWVLRLAHAGDRSFVELEARARNP